MSGQGSPVRQRGPVLGLVRAPDGPTSHHLQESLGFLLGGAAVLAVTAVLRGVDPRWMPGSLSMALTGVGAVTAAIGAAFTAVNWGLLRRRRRPA